MNSREIKIPIDDIEDPLNKASLAIDNLYLIRNSFYPENPDDKISKLQQESHYCLNLLDSIPPGKFSVVFNFLGFLEYHFFLFLLFLLVIGIIMHILWIHFHVLMFDLGSSVLSIINFCCILYF